MEREMRVRPEHRMMITESIFQKKSKIPIL